MADLDRRRLLQALAGGLAASRPSFIGDDCPALARDSFISASSCDWAENWSGQLIADCFEKVDECFEKK